MGNLPWRRYHYKYMPDSEGDALFQERIDELRADREFERVVIRYNGANTLAIDRFLHDHTAEHFDSPADVKVHPDQFLAKFSWPQEYPHLKYDDEVSEDVRVLGKIGAAIIQEVDPHLNSYNLLMDSLYDECFRMMGEIKQLAKVVGADITKLSDIYQTATKRLRGIDRLSIEDHIQHNPEDTANDIIGVLEHRRSSIVRRAGLFKTKAKTFIDTTVSSVLNGPHRKTILEEYRKVERNLTAAPVGNFINISKEEHPDFWANSHSWVFNCNERGIQKMYRIAWAMEINGYSEITSAAWPYPIKSITDFVVIAHQLMTRGNRTSHLSFNQKIVGINNLYNAARGLGGLFGTIYNTYRGCTYVEDSGVDAVYEEYNDFITKTIDGPQIGYKPLPEYVADSIAIISDSGNKLIKTMGMLNKGYAISLKTKSRSGRAASLSAEVSALDYEAGIQNAISLIMSSRNCTDDENGNREIAFTEFHITDDSKDDGVGLCLVMKLMKSYVGTVMIVDESAGNGSHWTINKNCHEVLYRTLREKPFGEEFSVKGIIFWNTTKTPAFVNQLYKANYLN